MDKNKSSLDIFQIGAMIFLALLFDILSIFPIVGIILAPLFYAILGTWLWTLGYGIISTKKLAGPVVSFIIEVIPALSILPSLLFVTGITIFIIKAEEKTGINVGELAKGDIKEGVEGAGNNKRKLSRRSREMIKRESQDGNVLTPKRNRQEKRVRRGELRDFREVA